MYATAFLHDTNTRRIHVCYFTLAPFPGGGDQPVNRWRSRGHHTAGAATQEEADQHMNELRERLGYATELGHVEWDGTLGITLLTPSKS